MKTTLEVVVFPYSTKGTHVHMYSVEVLHCTFTPLHLGGEYCSFNSTFSFLLSLVTFQSQSSTFLNVL